jgi:hypothetical protein
LFEVPNRELPLENEDRKTNKERKAGNVDQFRPEGGCTADPVGGYRGLNLHHPRDPITIRRRGDSGAVLKRCSTYRLHQVKARLEE